ncbi:glycoside hydrolase family 3 C-terminal domain-containing protein [uncultured Bacteroides sp.]|uniref:glycoside hydrolase family 3 C-terminal domain-containing protein n=1 Tax=uncultured Bacteroides sp. TaxID=162156 RepID=UPI002AABD1DD|nr:glycoside hydrolase family 3 C-terminal domain-containing protein [uncultured Bacteroides sp.]
MKIKYLLSLTLFIGSFGFIHAQSETALVEARVNDLISKMSLEEKIQYLGVYDNYCIRPIERLGIPQIIMSDGPVGVRNAGKSTSFPAGVLAASTWNRNLIEHEGKTLAQDCKARGVHILLSPGVNIMRSPLCGRNFEYYSEDPFLASQMAVALINGLQRNGVLACVKHFAGNNQEWDRGNVSSNIDKRTLHEIYLPAFKAAVMDAKVGTIMDGYNLVNGTYMTANKYLNIDVLRNQWGFKGIVMSDWGAAHDALADVKGGLDLEMLLGNAEQFTVEKLTKLIQEGKIDENMIDEKVANILRTIIHAGYLDHVQLDKSIPLYNPEAEKVSLNMAREGIVLLKNKNILPLDGNKIKKIAVVGPHANALSWGGGSSTTIPFNYSTLYTALEKMVGAKTKIVLVKDTLSKDNIFKSAVFYVTPESKERGLKAEYFNNPNLQGVPVYTTIDRSIIFDWQAGSPNQAIPVDNFSIRWTGVVRVPSSKIYTFTAKADDGYKLWVNGELIMDCWRDQSLTQNSAMYKFESGKDYSIKLEYYDRTGNATVMLGYQDNSMVIDDAVKQAKKSNIAVVCVGFNNDTEVEGADRTFSLPGYQDALINAVAKANPNTIVIVNAGGAVDMQNWINKVKGLVYAWYPGQDGGQALAEILYGKVNPSGKLPVTFDKKWEDNPCFNFYHAKDGKKEVEYGEGLLVGYRYYDTKKIEPQYPFGYGESYTRFAYSNMKVYPKDVNEYEVSFDIENTGKMDGAEIAQLYVKPINSRVFLPEKSLRGFEKIFLKRGEKRNITITVPADAFNIYNVDMEDFITNRGIYELLIGTSSRDIRLRAPVTIK